MTYIRHADLARALGWSEGDLRAVRRCTNCPVPPRRRDSITFTTNAILEWLTSILPRLDPATEVAIRSAAILEEKT